VICEIDDPLDIEGDNVFDGVDVLNATLYVPEASVAAYQAALVWQDFGMILPMPPSGPTTALETLCGGTLTSFSTNTHFVVVPEAQEYTFSITNQDTSEEILIITTNAYFQINELPNHNWNQSYSVKGKVKINGSYGAYGAVCTLNTPEKLIRLNDVFCNTTLANYNENLRSISMKNATAYKFRLNDGGAIQEIERPSRTIRVLNFNNISPNTTYQVSVTAFVDGAWLPYGEVCNITTATLPTSELRSDFCGGSTTSLTTKFKANLVGNATNYRFKTTIAGTDVFYENANRVCRMSNFAGATLNQTYSIQVAVETNGVWGPYGDACNWTVGTVGTRLIDEEDLANAAELFEIKAYPNPFMNQITLSLSNENTQSDIMVYDMTGKLIQQVSTQETTLEIGNNWSKGIYLVQIVQGQETKNIRMVKQ
jgi:hypothetical protein